MCADAVGAQMRAARCDVGASDASACAQQRLCVQARCPDAAAGEQQDQAGEALDSFMQGMAHEKAADSVRRLEHEARLTQEQIKQVTQLLDIADPSGDHRKRLLSRMPA